MRPQVGVESAQRKLVPALASIAPNAQRAGGICQSANGTAKVRHDWRGGLSVDVVARRRDSGVSSHMKLFPNEVVENSDAIKQDVLRT